jgi:hypothetical protein
MLVRLIAFFWLIAFRLITGLIAASVDYRPRIVDLRMDFG